MRSFLDWKSILSVWSPYAVMVKMMRFVVLVLCLVLVCDAVEDHLFNENPVKSEINYRGNRGENHSICAFTLKPTIGEARYYSGYFALRH